MLRVPLNTTPAQMARLMALQGAFAQVCNALSPLVAQSKVWNRVALHHLMYRTLRERFPDLGSQMVCNAIYSVSRTCRQVYQSPQSPFNLSRMRDKPLPTVRFSDNSPVYFDRHTLSVKDGQLSMYTLDGRIRFALALTPADEAQFRTNKLFEIMMSRRPDGLFELSFLFGEVASNQPASPAPESPPPTKLDAKGDVTMQVLESGGPDLPEYVLIEEAT